MIQARNNLIHEDKFHVYTKSQLKTETCEKTQERKTGSLPLNNSRGEHNYSLWRAQLLVVASSHLDHSLGEKDHSPMAS